MSDQQRPAPQDQDQPAEGGDMGQAGAETPAKDEADETDEDLDPS